MPTLTCLFLFTTALRAETVLSEEAVLFSSDQELVRKTDGVSVDEFSGYFVTQKTLPLDRRKAERVVLRLSSSKVLFSAFLEHSGDATFIALETSSDGQHWQSRLVYEKRALGHTVDGPIVPLDLSATPPARFVRVSLWRNGSGPHGFGKTFFHVTPLGKRVSTVESKPIETANAEKGLWVWAKAEDVPGEAVAKSKVPYQPPEIMKARAIDTGTLKTGLHSYLVRPYSKQSPDEPTTASQQLGRPSFWYRSATGPNGSILLDWSKASPKLKVFWDLFKEEEAPEDDLDAEVEAKPAVERGYEIWRKSSGNPVLHLAGRLTRPDASSWTDRGTTVEGAPLLKAKPSSFNAAGLPAASFGTLAPGTYYYRFSAIVPDGLTAATPAVKVTLNKGQSAAEFRLSKVIGASGYLVWRSNRPKRWAGTLVGILGEKDLIWHDTGLPQSSGTSIRVSISEAETKVGLKTATWKPLPKGKSIRLNQKTRWFKYRVLGVTHFPLQRKRVARILVSRHKPGPDELSARNVNHLNAHLEPFMVNAPHAWHSFSLFADAAISKPDARGRVRANALHVKSRGGTFLTRNFDVQVYSPIAGRWETLLEARNRSRLSMVISLDRTIHGRIRALGPYASYSGAYAFDPTPRVTPLLLPAEITDVAINGRKLRERPLFRNCIDGRIAVAAGESELGFNIKGLSMAVAGIDANAVPLTVIVSLAQSKEELIPVSRQIIKVRPGEVKRYRQRFNLAQPGEHRVQTSVRAGGKPYYEFTYWLMAGNGVELERLHPVYRGDLFASDPDRHFRFRISLSSGIEANVACKLVDLSNSSSVWTKAVQIRPGVPATVEIPVAGLRYGGYRFESDAGHLGKASSKLRLLPDVKGMTDCHLRSDGVVMRGGRPFLPIVLWYAPSPAVPEEGHDWIQECGINVVSSRNELLPRMNEAGVLQITGGPLRRAPDSREWDERRVIDQILKAPTDGRFAWDIGEELDIWNETKGRARGKSVWWSGYMSTYSLTRELMPFLPVSALSFDANSYTGPYSALARMADIFGLEPYLYLHYDDGADERSGAVTRFRSIIYTAAQAARARTRWNRPGQGEPSQKAVSVTLQAWDGRCWQPWKDRNAHRRALSLIEHRFMAYDAILLGATILQYYNFHCDYWHMKFNPLHWEGWRAVVEEVASLSPVLSGPDMTKEIRRLEGSVDIGAREHEDYFYLIVANYRGREGTFAVELPDRWINVQRIAVVSEDRSIGTDGRILRDTIGPFGVHIYTNNTHIQPTRIARLLNDPRFNSAPARSRITGNYACEWNGAKISASYNIWNFGHQVFANDGDPETAYITATWMKKPAVPPPYVLTISLADTRVIDQIIIRSWRPKYWPDTSEILEDYLLEVGTEGQWQKIARVDGNREEVMKHSFESRPADAVRLTVEKGLFVNEIEAYGPD